MHGDKDTVVTENRAKESYMNVIKSGAITEYSVVKGIGHEMNL
jgi:hypothetical protein